MSEAGELVDRIGVRLHPTRNDSALLPVSPGVIHAGELLASALMLAADIASGIRLHDPDVTMVLTSSFSLRRAAATTVEPVVVTPTQLFANGRRVVDRIDFRSETGATVANGLITFVVRRGEPDPSMQHDRGRSFRIPWTQPIEQPLIDAAGIETVDAATGRVAMRAGSDVRRKIGILQGSMVTLLGEASALALAEHTFAMPAVVHAVDVDFLAPASAHNFSTEARWLAEPGATDIEVLLHDDQSSSPLAVFLVGVTRAQNR